MVQNIKGEPLTDAFVQINNDSTEYLPLADIYTIKPESVDRVRVRFENAPITQWTKVSKKPYQSLQIVVQTSLDLKNFIILNNVKFKEKGEQLIKVITQ
ncbi:hypothetical protein GCM10027051_29710 [Niabella terrae]